MELILKKPRRPSWMTPFGEEGGGDVFLDRLWPEWQRDMGEQWNPNINFYEKDDIYYLTAEVAGMEKDDISVTFEEDRVTIKGKKESGLEEEGVSYYMKETGEGVFCRSFRLPKEVDDEKVDATYKDGVLTLIIPHKAGAKARKIEIH